MELLVSTNSPSLRLASDLESANAISKGNAAQAHPRRRPLKPKSRSSALASRRPKATLRGDAPPLGKFLASNDKSTRDKALEALHRFLAGDPNLPSNAEIFANSQLDTHPIGLRGDSTQEPGCSSNEHGTAAPRHKAEGLELVKLYKGLFYCFWMSDKPLVQQHLAQELAHLCLVVKPLPSHSDPEAKSEHMSTAELGQVRAHITECGLYFWWGFWDTLLKEWHGIDRHRLDKYLLWVRRFVQVGFRLLGRAQWNHEAISRWSKILMETVFNVSDPRTPMSITYHYIDVFLEELDRTLTTESAAPLPPPSLPELLQPLCHAVSTAPPGSILFKKVVEEVFDPLMANLSPICSAATGQSVASSDHKPDHAVFLNLQRWLSDQPLNYRAEMLKSIFKAGSDPSCPASNRRKMYKYWTSLGGDEVTTQ